MLFNTQDLLTGLQRFGESRKRKKQAAADKRDKAQQLIFDELIRDRRSEKDLQNRKQVIDYNFDVGQVEAALNQQRAIDRMDYSHLLGLEKDKYVTANNLAEFEAKEKKKTIASLVSKKEDAQTALNKLIRQKLSFKTRWNKAKDDPITSSDTLQSLLDEQKQIEDEIKGLKKKFPNLQDPETQKQNSGIPWEL